MGTGGKLKSQENKQQKLKENPHDKTFHWALEKIKMHAYISNTFFVCLIFLAVLLFWTLP